MFANTRFSRGSLSEFFIIFLLPLLRKEGPGEKNPPPQPLEWLNDSSFAFVPLGFAALLAKNFFVVLSPLRYESVPMGRAQERRSFSSFRSSYVSFDCSCFSRFSGKEYCLNSCHSCHSCHSCNSLQLAKAELMIINGKNG